MKRDDFKSVAGKKLFDLIVGGDIEKEKAWRAMQTSTRFTPEINAPIPAPVEPKHPAAIVEKPTHPALEERTVSGQSFRPVKIPELLELFENSGVVGEKENLLKMTLDSITNTSFFLTGKSSAGKSYLINALLRVLPSELVYRFNETKNGALFKHADKFKDKILVIYELQTFFRGSGNEKDALRCIANHEPYTFVDEKGNQLVVDARMVMTSGADQNRYKKMYLDGDVELMRRFHDIRVELNEEKIKNRIAEKNKRFKRNVFTLEGQVLVDEAVVRAYVKHCMKRPDVMLCNPYVDFLSDYVTRAVTDNGDLTAVSKTDDQCKKYVSASAKWNLDERKYSHNSLDGYIAGLEDAHIAKLLIDHDLQRSVDFDWRACWESGLESMRAAQFPAEVIADYVRRHVVNDSIVVVDPITNSPITLVDYRKPVDRKAMVVSDLVPVFRVDGQEFRPCEIVREDPRDAPRQLPYNPRLLEYKGDQNG